MLAPFSLLCPMVHPRNVAVGTYLNIDSSHIYTQCHTVTHLHTPPHNIAPVYLPCRTPTMADVPYARWTTTMEDGPFTTIIH